MAIINCRKCGKMFNYLTGDKICPNCKAAAEEKFQEVKKFVQDNKQASIPEICEVCSVDGKQVKQWIREERLFFSDDSPVKISCEICGTQISTGRYCEACKKTTANGFASMSRPAAPAAPKPAPKADPGSKMFTFRG